MHVGTADKKIENDIWRDRICKVVPISKRPVIAMTPLGKPEKDSWSKPVIFHCSDGEDYYVKAKVVGRAVDTLQAMISDHVVANLGKILGAPVATPRLVEVTKEIITKYPDAEHMVPGVAHGTLAISRCSERENIKHIDANRDRFALLAALFGWVHAGDHQFIYKNAPPHLVFSVDHGHFFPGGVNRTSLKFEENCNPEIDLHLSQQVKFNDEEIKKAISNLESITDSDIAQAVSSLPDDWITMDERIEMADYLAKRRDAMITKYRKM